jgi:hypothetical protein
MSASLNGVEFLELTRLMNHFDKILTLLEPEGVRPSRMGPHAPSASVVGSMIITSDALGLLIDHAFAR